MEHGPRESDVVFVKPSGSENIPFVPDVRSDEDAELIKNHWAEARRQVLEALPDRSDGLSKERINDFVENLGLHVGEYIFIDESDLGVATEVLRSVGLPQANLAQSMAAYYYQMDLAIIVRFAADEELNGPVFTESVAVHELIHMSSEHRLIRGTKTSPDHVVSTMPRVGHQLESASDGAISGEYLEEGFAEYIRAKYISEALGRPDGFANQAGRETTFSVTEDRGIHIPNKYLHWKNNDELTFKASSFAGIGVERLIENDPELLSAFIRARHSVDGLREVAYRIDRIKKGLYRELTSLERNERNFANASLLVEDALELLID